MLKKKVKSTAWQALAAIQWVKEILMNELLDPSSTVAEFFCGGGVDLNKFARAKIGSYRAFDILFFNVKNFILSSCSLFFFGCNAFLNLFSFPQST